jgi:hypothetical protein
MFRCHPRGRGGKQGCPMKLFAAWIQVMVVLLVVGYGTWQLFEGNFAQSFATLPFLFAYYIFVVVRHKRNQYRSDEDSEQD